MEVEYLYDKYPNCDIVLCCYLESTGSLIEDYSPFAFADWERNKFNEFKKAYGYPENKLYNKYLEFLVK